MTEKVNEAKYCCKEKLCFLLSEEIKKLVSSSFSLLVLIEFSVIFILIWAKICKVFLKLLTTELYWKIM